MRSPFGYIAENTKIHIKVERLSRHYYTNFPISLTSIFPRLK